MSHEVMTTSGALTPAEVVAGAKAQAEVLMDIVTKTGCYQEIRGKKYLQVEAWETIGAFNRVHAETKGMIPMLDEDGKTIIGYQAQVQLLGEGQVVGGAIMPCFFSENACKGKQGDEKHKACMSAAQTFATSKAYRMNFSYVAILAGYQPQPAEEVDADEQTKKKGAGTIAIDMDWLKLSMDQIPWGWADCAEWIRAQFKEAKGKTFTEIVRSLTFEHQEALVKEVEHRLEVRAA